MFILVTHMIIYRTRIFVTVFTKPVGGPLRAVLSPVPNLTSYPCNELQVRLPPAYLSQTEQGSSSSRYPVRIPTRQSTTTAVVDWFSQTFQTKVTFLSAVFSLLISIVQTLHTIES